MGSRGNEKEAERLKKEIDKLRWVAASLSCFWGGGPILQLWRSYAAVWEGGGGEGEGVGGGAWWSLCLGSSGVAGALSLQLRVIY